MARSIDLGVNVLDVVPFVRAGRDEEALARALTTRRREEIIIMTHAGILNDPVRSFGEHTRWVQDRYVSRGIFAWDELALGKHTIAPRFVTESIDASLSRLGTAVDVLLLEAPATQLTIAGESSVHRRIQRAFEALERAVSDRKIVRYGVADVSRLQLETLVELARAVAGDAHRLAVIETPVSLHDGSSVALRTQTVRGRARTILEAADELGLYVCATGAVLGGAAEYEMDRETRATLGAVSTDAQIGLQWARSLRGVGTVLVGASRELHVEENCRVATLPLLADATVAAFVPSADPPDDGNEGVIR